MEHEEVRKVVDIINDIRVGMFTTHTSDGLVSRPLTVMEVALDGDLWFFAAGDSDIVGEIASRSDVNVAFAGSKQWVSVSGKATINREVEKKRELWNSMVEIFVTGGPESPDTVLLHVESDSAEYWENPGGMASLLTSWVKRKVTGEAATPGDSSTVEL